MFTGFVLSHKTHTNAAHITTPSFCAGTEPGRDTLAIHTARYTAVIIVGNVNGNVVDNFLNKGVSCGDK